MFCKIVNNQVTRISDRAAEDSVPLILSEVNHDDPDNRFVGYEYKVKNGYVLGIPVYSDRSPEDRAKVRRKLAESAAAIEYNNVGLRADDKAIAMLQGYINVSIASVEWKGMQGFITLTLTDMQAVLNLMMAKRAELFLNEKNQV